MLRITTQLSNRAAMKEWQSPPPYIMNDELQDPKSEERLFKGWPGPAEGVGRLDPEEEILLFKQMHYCGYRLSLLYREAKRRRALAVTERRYGEWSRRYSLIRARLTEGNIGLVYDLIGRSRFRNLDYDELSSEGMMAMLRAVDTFDPWRGYRFSTYACNAIMRAFSRSSLMESKRRGRIAGSFDVDFEKGDAVESRHADQRALFGERLQEILRMDGSTLTQVEKTVLARRFPLEEDRERQTLEEVGRQMRISKERVRQIQLSAIAKLRRALARDRILR